MAFRSVLPSRWVVRDESHDYGIDASVEIVSSSGEVTGKRFFVQLKGTDAQTTSRALTVRLKVSTFRYWQRLDAPVLVVLYHAPTKKLYARWVYDMDPFFATKSKEHLVFQCEESDEIEKPTADAHIEQAMDDWRWLHSPWLAPPISLRLSLAPTIVGGASPADVVAQLSRLTERFREAIDISEVPVAKVRGEIHVTAEEIRVRLFGGGGAWIHRSLAAARSRVRKGSDGGRSGRRKPSRTTPSVLSTDTAVAADVLAAIAFAFSSSGHQREAAMMAELAFGQARVSQDPRAAVVLARILILSGKHAVVLRAATSLLRDRHHLLAESIAGTVWLSPPPGSNRIDLRAALEQWLAALPPDYPRPRRGTAHYNVGRYVGRQDWDVRAGISHFIAAAREDSSYLARAYYWEELGAMFFHIDRFLWSARAYGVAARLGNAPQAFAKQADALWRTGRFGQARDVLSNYSGKDAHWILLRHVIEIVLRTVGAEAQKRDPVWAETLGGQGLTISPESLAARDFWLAAIRVDGLSTLAWFNLGVCYTSAAEYDSAASAFLVAAFIRPGDSNAWADAICSCVLSLQRGDHLSEGTAELLSLISTTAAQRDREGVFRAMLNRVPADFAEGAAGVRALFDSIAPRVEPAPVIRLTSDVAVEEIEVQDTWAAWKRLFDQLPHDGSEAD